ncbi:MAG: hypothetical protein KDB09_01055, partial [Acidimicrobiales bacterium]|nr:hypothetical protein [Acidimicrobiales bacterium]
MSDGVPPVDLDVAVAPDPAGGDAYGWSDDDDGISAGDSWSEEDLALDGWGDEPQDDAWGDEAWDGDIEAGESHRGAFGDYGGENRALIERNFRERIIIVGVTLGGADPDQTDADLAELALLVDTAGAD